MKTAAQKATQAKKSARKAVNLTLPATIFAELESAEKKSDLSKSILVQLALQDFFEARKKVERTVELK